MHSTDASGTPQFLKKLWKLVEDTAYDKLISWGQNGATFVIKNQAQFAKDVLPLYFKHNNITSFIRQLNMYGFSKVANIEQGGLKSENDDVEFQHDEGYFVKGQESLLPLIKRKISAGRSQDKAMSKNASFNQFLMEANLLKTKHDNMENSFANLKRENEVIWRELGTLRQKYAKQQQMINKMIQFLVGMVSHSSTNRVVSKRKLPLMITDQSIKREKTAPGLHFSLEEAIPSNLQADSPASGPVIHDVTEIEGIGSNQFLLVDPNTEEPVNEISTVLQQLAESKENGDANVDANTALPNNQISCDMPSTSSAFVSTDIPPTETESANAQSTIAIPTKKEIVDHMGNMQNELDSLRELLQSNYSIDASTFMDLFNPEDPVFPTSSLLDEIGEDKNEVTGTEVVQYHPSLLELTDDELNFFQVPTTSSEVDLNEFENDDDCILPTLPTDDTNETLNTPDPILPNISFTAKKPT